jgi:hypothetical protein
MNKHFKCTHDVIIELLEKEILRTAPESYNTVLCLEKITPALKKSISRTLMNLNYSFTWTPVNAEAVYYLRVDWGP